MSTVAQDILAVIEAAGEAVCIACPGCKALVDIGEELAKTALTPTTEGQRVQTAEDALVAADVAAEAALAKT